MMIPFDCARPLGRRVVAAAGLLSRVVASGRRINFRSTAAGRTSSAVRARWAIPAAASLRPLSLRPVSSLNQNSLLADQRDLVSKPLAERPCEVRSRLSASKGSSKKTSSKPRPQRLRLSLCQIGDRQLGSWG